MAEHNNVVRPWFIAGTVLVGFGIVAVVANVDCRHWFIVPTLLAGLPYGRETLRGFTGERDIISTRIVVAAACLYNVTFAPILHVWTDYWMLYIEPPPDWRPWLGWMAVINIVCAVVYFTTLRLLTTRSTIRPTRRVWSFDKRRMLPILPLCLLVSLAMEVYVYADVGGVVGYMSAARDIAAFQSMGWFFIVSESFPATLLVWFLMKFQSQRKTSFLLIAGLLLVEFVSLIFFGGLRGSRAVTVWTMFWAGAAIHTGVRPIPRKFVPIAGVLLLVFMWSYGLYKALNIDLLGAINSSGTVVALGNETSRNVSMIMLGDLERSDVQAFTLYRLSISGDDYQLAQGRTYAAAMALLVPRAIWKDRPDSKNREGTELFWDSASYYLRGAFVQNIYGLTGEGLLNFPIGLVPLLFVLPAGFVAWLDRSERRLSVTDSRRILLPLGTIVAVWLVLADLDNVLWVVVKHVAWPVALVWLGSTTFRLREAAPVREMRPTVSRLGSMPDVREV